MKLRRQIGRRERVGPTVETSRWDVSTLESSRMLVSSLVVDSQGRQQ